MASSKSAVRDRLRSIRDAIPSSERKEQAGQVVRWLTAWRLWREAGSVLLYRSIGSEVDTAPLFEAAWDAGMRVGAPRVIDGRIRAVAVNRATAFSPGAFGVPEPAARPGPEDAVWDLVVVPGIAFDRAGHRLGYGMGYYDAFLAGGVAGATVGLAYRQTLVDAVPVADHDVPVEWVATPAGFQRAEP